MGSAVEMVRRFRSLRVLVLGDAMLDTYLEGTAARLCSEGPVPVVRKTAEHQFPGGAANTAANLRALGAEVLFLGVVGRDAVGDLLRASLRSLGIDDGWLVEDADAHTVHKMRVLADGQYVVRFDDEAGRKCSGASVAGLLDRLESAFARCDLVVVSDYVNGVACPPVLNRLRALREARHCPLVVDSKNLTAFAGITPTVITPNRLEAQVLVSGAADAGQSAAETTDRGALARLGQLVLARVNAEHAAITLAADGVLLADRDGHCTLLPAHPVPYAYDVGAGDSFTSALALALGAGGTMVEAAQIGLDAASLSVTRRFTAVVQHQELLQRVSQREHATSPLGDAAGMSVEHLAAHLAGLQRAGKTVVFTNGVFDILHAGHVQMLRQARMLGDVLVVGVNSDRSARRLKGENRPIIGERDRLALVSALDSVDHVVLFDEDTPSELIRALRPTLHVKGGDYADEALPEADAVREVGGKVVILPLAGSLSTSAVIERIVMLTAARAAGDATREIGAPR